MSRRGERPGAEALAALPVAVDAMGGDKSPGEIVEGARRVAADDGIPVVLVGPPDQVGDTFGLPLVACSEVIAMDEDPAGGVRRKKDSSLVRAAELVRDGKGSAMVSLLSIGEEPTKGTPLVKETHALLSRSGGSTGAEFAFEFVGNLEGRDLLPSPADVIVTDGFTGNVALKALEGSLRFLFDAMLGVFSTNDETKAAADVLLPYLLPMAAEFEPENTGGAMLLGTDGVCVISHGSSNAVAMVNAVRVAYECATRGLVDHVAAAVRPAQDG